MRTIVWDTDALRDAYLSSSLHYVIMNTIIKSFARRKTRRGKWRSQAWPQNKH